MLAPAVIEELRLTKFKSFYDAVLPLRDLTLLIGRNGSGKSNIVDALEVLSKLALGEDIRDSIDGGRREGASVRGGVEGCAPLRAGRALRSDRLGTALSEGGQSRPRAARERPPDPERGDLSARYYNGKQGPNPALPFRSSRLLTSQVATKIASTSSR